MKPVPLASTPLMILTGAALLLGQAAFTRLGPAGVPPPLLAQLSGHGSGAAGVDHVDCSENAALSYSSTAVPFDDCLIDGTTCVRCQSETYSGDRPREETVESGGYRPPTVFGSCGQRYIGNCDSNLECQDSPSGGDCPQLGTYTQQVGGPGGGPGGGGGP